MSQQPREIRLASREEVLRCVRELAAQQQAYAVEGFGSRREVAAPEGAIHARLSLSALDRIERLDTEDMTCRVQCGLRLSDLMAALDEKEFTLESGPFSEPDARSLGGLFSHAPHSPRGWDRGAIRSQLLGFSGLDGSGREFAAGGRVVKNVAGYDLMKLFVGGGGAWFTGLELELRLIRRPALTRVFSSDPLALDAALEIWRSLRPAWIEARSLDLHLLGDGSAQVELLVAGHQRRIQAYTRPAVLPHDESGPELWDCVSAASDTTLPTHRGHIRVSESPAWIHALPAGCRGSLHLHGHYSLTLRASGQKAGQKPVPLADQQAGAALPGLAASSMLPAALALSRRLKHQLAPLLAPGRLSFDTALPLEGGA